MPAPYTEGTQMLPGAFSWSVCDKTGKELWISASVQVSWIYGKVYYSSEQDQYWISARRYITRVRVREVGGGSRGGELVANKDVAGAFDIETRPRGRLWVFFKACISIVLAHDQEIVCGWRLKVVFGCVCVYILMHLFY
jgi:hypothetical protein